MRSGAPRRAVDGGVRADGYPDMIDSHVRFGDDLGVTDVDALLRLLDTHGVRRAVLGPVGRWVAVDNREGNETIAAAVRHHPDRLAGWAAANPWYGVRAVDDLRRALDDGLVGLKLAPAQQGFPLLSPLVDGLLHEVAQRAVPVYVVTGIPVAAEPFQLTELARRWPTVPFVMGRSGRTDFALDLVPALSGAANLVAETAYNGPGHLRRVAEAIGVDRMLFASDLPANDLGLELARVDDAGFDEPARAQVLGAVAARLFAGPGFAVGATAGRRTPA
ncbi:amidohydrolase family protein [Micromonospora cathayae]|uniref:Amidohydrolase family protein n=1 Tax=Micromonospora cathayae TaxID=3028804 RepID=A0ABY7ZIQ8_9ACTN|nr:amidohydrolase family protein [Micromonospora sp. HUAS 3]WDZ82651.1 amidohydrolase family protein [Micromonospora sp. HUAS 3]